MKEITINVNSIAEMYPVRKKDFLRECHGHYWYLKYFKGETMYSWFHIKKGIAYENMFRNALSGEIISESKLIARVSAKYSDEEFNDAFVINGGTLYMRPHVCITLVTGDEYTIYKDTYMECQDYIDELKRNFNTLQTIKVY